MTDKTNPAPDVVDNEQDSVLLGLQKVKLERFKVWGKIITVSITVFFGSVLGVFINHSYQNRQLDLEAMKYLGAYVDYALVKDGEKRLRFAEYFATLSPSKTFQNNWINYYNLIDKKENELIAKRSELDAARQVENFVKTSLDEDVTTRLRVAEFHAEFSTDTDVKKKWTEYRDSLLKAEKDLKEKKRMLAEAEKASNEEEIKFLKKEVDLMKEQLKSIPKKQVSEIQRDVDKLQAQLSELPEGSTDFMTVEKAERLLLNENWEPRNYTINKFEEITTIKDDKVVKDNATGLMWEQSGSKETMDFRGAKAYVDKLNRDRFADNSDWRLPTLKEAITLLKKEKNNNGLYVGVEFDEKQKWIWTSDMYSASRAWVVGFTTGSCSYDDIGDDLLYVRAVR